MRALTTIGVAAVLVMGPTAASATTLQSADATQVTTVTKPVSLQRSSGATTNGWLSDFGCFFYGARFCR